MPITIQQIRQQYPDYQDLSDEELADKLHAKFYSDISKEEFHNKIQFNSPSMQPQKANAEPEANTLNAIANSPGVNAVIGAGNLVRDVTQGALTGLGKGGQAIASSVTGGKAPTVNMDEIYSPVGSGEQGITNRLARGVGEYLPYGVAGGASIPGQMIAGATHGALTTAPGEQNLGGMLPEGPLGAAIEGTAMGAIPAGKKLVGFAKEAVSKIRDITSPSKLADAIMAGRNAAKEKYNDLYEGLFGEAKNKGLSDTPLRSPKIDIDLIKDNAADKYTKSLEEFNKNPTLENAHWAQSDMGKLIDYYDKMYNRGGLTTPQIKAWKEAKAAQKRIRGSIFSGLTKNGETDLANKYGDVTEGYKREVGPYLKSKPVNDLRRNEITKKEFANRRFSPALKELHPEIGQREMLNSLLKITPLKALVAGIGTGLGLKKGYESYKDYGNQ